MNTETVKAIKVLTERAGDATKACDSLQFSQAALNLAHTAQVAKLAAEV